MILQTKCGGEEGFVYHLATWFDLGAMFHRPKQESPFARVAGLIFM